MGRTWNCERRLPRVCRSQGPHCRVGIPGLESLCGVLALINRSLVEARSFYAPKAKAPWSGLFYQYANRLAHHYFLTKLNGVSCKLIFLYFVNADDMLGPMSEEEWHGASRLIHAILGLPNDLRPHGIFDAFLDARLLQDVAS